MKLTTPTDELGAVWEADWATRPGFVTPEHRSKNTNWQELAVSDADQAVGMVAVCTAGSAAIPEGHIVDVWIHPEHRGHGHGHQAARLAEQWCREHEVPVARVSIPPNNPAASAVFGDYQPTARHMELPVDSAPQLPDEVAAAPLGLEEYDAWVEHGIRGFAQQVTDNNQVAYESALLQARNTFDRMLPNGMHTPHNEIWNLKAGGRLVGRLWVYNDEVLDEIFVCKVETLETERGKGYGRLAMRLAEQRAEAHGRGKIRLNVFASNTVANNLYHSLGYQVTAEFRIKGLTGA